MSHSDDVSNRQYRSERVRNMGDGNQGRPWPKALLELVHYQFTVIVNRCDDKSRARLLRDQLPRHDVRMVLEGGNQDLVPGLQMRSSVAGRDEVDGVGGSADKDDLTFARGID